MNIIALYKNIAKVIFISKFYGFYQVYSLLLICNVKLNLICKVILKMEVIYYPVRILANNYNGFDIKISERGKDINTGKVRHNMTNHLLKICCSLKSQ